MIWKLYDLLNWNTEKEISRGVWVPCRPENWKYRTLRYRCRAAWLVFSGRADAVIWPKQ